MSADVHDIDDVDVSLTELHSAASSAAPSRRQSLLAADADLAVDEVRRASFDALFSTAIEQFDQAASNNTALPVDADAATAPAASAADAPTMPLAGVLAGLYPPDALAAAAAAGVRASLSNIVRSPRFFLARFTRAKDVIVPSGPQAGFVGTVFNLGSLFSVSILFLVYCWKRQRSVV